MKQKLVVAVTGAGGSIYAKVLFDKLQLLKDQIETVAVVMSDNAKDVGNMSWAILTLKNPI